MIPCQVSMIAEICICHAKICETVLRYKTTLKINRSPSLTTDTQEARIPIADESPTKLNINKVG